MPGLQDWWRDMPIVTKWGMAGAFGFTLAAQFGLIPYYYLMFDPPSIYKQFQVWRLATCFMYMGRLGLPFLMNMLYWFKYSSSLETSIFENRLADYVWMLCCGAVFLLIPGYFFGLPILGAGIIYMVLYYWSRKNPDVTLSFMFGITFQAVYLPWVLIGFQFLMGGLPFLEILGVLAGHSYFFLDTVLPATHGKRYVQTPRWFTDRFPQRLNRAAAPRAPGQQDAAHERGHAWGAGRPLNG